MYRITPYFENDTIFCSQFCCTIFERFLVLWSATKNLSCQLHSCGWRHKFFNPSWYSLPLDMDSILMIQYCSGMHLIILTIVQKSFSFTTVYLQLMEWFFSTVFSLTIAVGSFLMILLTSEAVVMATPHTLTSLSPIWKVLCRYGCSLCFHPATYTFCVNIEQKNEWTKVCYHTIAMLFYIL